MDNKENGSGDLPPMMTMEPEEVPPLTPAELKMIRNIAQKMGDVEIPPPKTQVNSGTGEPVAQKVKGSDFIFIAPVGYIGEICEICHMPPKEGCINGVFGLDPKTGRKQLDPNGQKGSFLACEQKKEWRNHWLPLLQPQVSNGETKLPPPGTPVSVESDLEKNDGGTSKE